MRHVRGLVVAGGVGLTGALFAFAPVTAASGRPAGGSASGPGARCDLKRHFCGRLFVIAVGVDAPQQGGWSLQYSEPDAAKLVARLLRDRVAGSLAGGLRTDWLKPTISTPPPDALTDSIGLPRAIAALANPADTTTRVQIALLTGHHATLKRLEAAFEQVVRKARPDDIFVFSFGGVSRSVADTTAPGEYYFRLGSIRNFLDDDEVRGAGLSSSRLRRWIDNVTAQRQMILLEAGDMREFLPEFVAAMTESRPGVVGLIERDRIIVAPRVFGVERTGIGAGALAHAVVASPASLFGLFSEMRAVAEARLSRLADSASEKEGYLRVFYERDFLDIYARIVARAPPSRGVGVTPAGDTARLSRSPTGRNVALLIATNRYDAAGTWRQLNNPIFDAQTLDTVLRTRFGFETKVLVDQPLDSIRSAIFGLIKGRSWSKTDQLLIFVAGHGYYEEGTGSGMGTGYIVARDSRPLAEDPTYKTYVSYPELTAWVEKIPSEHTLLILDACFSGTFADAGTRSGPDDEYADSDLAKFINDKLERRSRLFLTSGGKEYVSDGSVGGHSPFAYRLIDALLRAGDGRRPLTMSSLRAQVERAKPMPRAGTWGRNEPGGDFLFVPVRAFSKP